MTIFSRPSTVKVESMTVRQWQQKQTAGQAWYNGRVIIYSRRRYPRPACKLFYEIHTAPSGWTMLAPDELVEVETT